MSYLKCSCVCAREGEKAKNSIVVKKKEISKQKTSIAQPGNHINYYALHRNSSWIISAWFTDILILFILLSVVESQRKSIFIHIDVFI